MARGRILRIYLDDIPRERAAKGNFNFVNRIRNAFESQGFRVELCRNAEAERLKSATRQGYSLFHMDDPFHDRALTMRKAYFYPFWRIEPTAERWDYEVARAGFDPAIVDPVAAERFCRNWRYELFPRGALDGDPAGHVYIPLQGRLLEQRSFQAARPLDMIEAVVRHEPRRDAVIGLHPGETYLPEEIDALKALIDRHPRLRLSSAPTTALVAGCDYIVTENSSVALYGFFAKKPCVLFAKIDFHHIAADVAATGAAKAIAAAPEMAPDYERYLFWFLRMTTISGAAEDAEARILETVRRHGWQV